MPSRARLSARLSLWPEPPPRPPSSAAPEPARERSLRRSFVLELQMRPIRIIQTAAIAIEIAGLIGGAPARAEFKLRYPAIDYREFEVEHNGSISFDKKNSGKSNNQSYPTEVEVGILPFWTV